MLFASAFIIAAFIFLSAASKASAELNVNINIGPPPIVVTEPREVIFVPGWGVYFVPGLSFDVFYYGGYWWSPRGEKWYRSISYSGSWVVIEPRFVPRPVFGVPRNYRAVYMKEKNIKHIPFGQWKKQWGSQKGPGKQGIQLKKSKQGRGRGR